MGGGIALTRGVRWTPLEEGEVRGNAEEYADTRLLHGELASLSMRLWVLICHYCAEIDAENLRLRRSSHLAGAF